MLVKKVRMKKMLNQFKKVHVGHVNFARIYKTQNSVNILVSNSYLAPFCSLLFTKKITTFNPNIN